MLKPAYPYYLGNRPEFPNGDLEVFDKFTGEIATRVAQADSSALERAIGMAASAAASMRSLATHQRQAVLNHCARRFVERAEELAQALCVEAGKPIRDSRGEVARLVDTFRCAAEETPRLLGEVMPMDISPRANGYFGMWKRVPIGPCSFISPFNFPLNLAAHKIAPALAVGCPFVLKPASLTPVSALLIGEVLAETDLPPGAFSILPCPRETADVLVTDKRLKFLSFTGSPDVGWALKARAGKKKVTLELGGNAGCMVEADADVGDAAARLVIGAFYQSGQSCISVQRILAHESIYDSLRDQLVAETKKLKAGDPKSEDTFIGPMISVTEAARVEAWIQSAVRRGARVLCGGGRRGSMVEATLLEKVPADENISCEEAFGPVAILSPFHDFKAALQEINRSRYGLQAGVFTRDIHKAHLAWDRLEVGGVIINDAPSWRVDHMPYGGVKDSGLGREGLRFAMEEMTEVRMFVLRPGPV